MWEITIWVEFLLQAVEMVVGGLHRVYEFADMTLKLDIGSLE